jgi:hypothetical protein
MLALGLVQRRLRFRLLAPFAIPLPGSLLALARCVTALLLLLEIGAALRTSRSLSSGAAFGATGFAGLTCTSATRWSTLEISSETAVNVASARDAEAEVEIWRVGAVQQAYPHPSRRDLCEWPDGQTLPEAPIMIRVQ